MSAPPAAGARAASVVRALRAPRAVIAELLAICAGALALAVVPQETDPAGHARFAEGSPRLATAARLLGLDQVLHAPWFLAAVALAACSLVLVQIDQWRRLARTWGAAPGDAGLASAPYRVSFVRPGVGGAMRQARRRRRGGLLGAPVFHLGLLVVVVAALSRALLGATAVANVVEGETLEPGEAAWARQWPGWLAPRIALDRPIRLDELRLERHSSGALRSLDARVLVGTGPGARSLDVGINAPLSVDGAQVFLSHAFGLAALVSFESSGETAHRAVLLRQVDGRVFEGGDALPGAVELRLRAFWQDDRTGPSRIELRAARGGALLALGPLEPGRPVALPGAGTLRLEGVRRWVRLDASRDSALPLAFTGFLLVALGAFLMVVVVPVDEWIVTEPAPGGERVTVALRPHRFAPMYEEKFERLVRAQGGTDPGADRG